MSTKWLDNTQKWLDSPNKWERGGEKWLENSEKVLIPADSFSGLADVADKLAANSFIMDYYSSFEKGTYGFFFSPNQKLNSATNRPSKFGSWDDWDLLARNQIRTLSVLGGFKEDATDVIRNNTDLDKLKAAYIIWPSNLYSVFWQNEKFKGVWTCNIFVGDAIYLWKKNAIINDNRHYFGPSDIKEGKGPFKKLTTNKVSRGVIVVFGSTHTEIITNIKKYKFSDDGFCSIGAGRGSRDSTGTIRCDSSMSPYETREIENPNNTYYTL